MANVFFHVTSETTFSNSFLLFFIISNGSHKMSSLNLKIFLDCCKKVMVTSSGSASSTQWDRMGLYIATGGDKEAS